VSSPHGGGGGRGGGRAPPIKRRSETREKYYFDRDAILHPQKDRRHNTTGWGRTSARSGELSGGRIILSHKI